LAASIGLIKSAPMRVPVAFGIYLAAIFIGGALLAPPLHSLATWASDPFPVLTKLAYQPFHRYVNRCFMVIAILVLWPLSRIAKLGREDVGWKSDDQWTRQLFRGLAFGFVTLAIPALFCTLMGGRAIQWPQNATLLAKHFGNAIGAAVLVSLLEESVFRGVVFGALRKHSSLAVAVAFSSSVYALVHFFERTQHEGDVVWTSGLALLPKMTRGFADWQMIVPGFFSLTIAGAILASAVWKTGNLYFSIGLHAGWIFWLKSFKFFTREGGNSHAWLLGSEKLIDGWAAFFVLLVTLILLTRTNYFAGGIQNGETTQGTG
jgi:membrane protease YdiL (CAAX protease family)